LVKTLSTLLSTAALDKSKQSRQRGKRGHGYVIPFQYCTIPVHIIHTY
jgi:hypothetical protein